jgi:glycosyltransferase involved in cell wall biosynthesis
MRILFLHPNMPGQYKHLARAFAEEGGHEIVFLTKHLNAEIPGVKRITYALPRQASPHTHRYLAHAEQAVLQGQEVWRMCKKLKESGFTPDIIIGHPGWGDGLFVKEIFPGAPCLFFFEFFYRAHGADVGFNPEDKLTMDDVARVRMKNVTNQIALDTADFGICPTWWQWSMHPKEYRHKLAVLHDGVNIAVARPDATASYTTPKGKTFNKGDKVVTYIARNFEPYRGFPTFMQAAEILLRERPDIHILAVGADEVSYGKKAKGGKTYRQIWMEKVTLDRERIHFVGTVAYDDLMRIFQLSAAHIYLTYPFVLSWSMLEAMACGVPLIASRTVPVQEVVTHEQHGLLADFFSPEDVAAQVMRMLDAPEFAAACGKEAREIVARRYDLQKLLPLHMQLVRDVASGATPNVVAFERVNPKIDAALWK